MEMAKKFLGAEHPFTLISMENIASFYMSHGRWNEAEQLQVQITEMKKKLLSEKLSVNFISLAI